MAGGRRPLPWIKLWYEMLGDPKMSRLSIAETGCWCKILLLAGQSPVRGKLMVTETEPMTIGDISKALNLTNREVSNLKSCISKMEKMDSIRWNGDGVLEVIHFKERQEVYPSDFESCPRGEGSKLRDNSALTPRKPPIGSELAPNSLSPLAPSPSHSLTPHTPRDAEGRGERKDISLPDGKDIYSPSNGLTELFDLWNSLSLIKHRKLTGDMKRALAAASRDFSAVEISQAMRNYAHIVNDERCFFKYRWTLGDFLKRGLEKFLDLEVALNNYRRGGDDGTVSQHSGARESLPAKRIRFDPSKPLR